MAITPKFSINDIDKVFQQSEKQYHEQMIRTLRYVGEKAVNEAKANGSYQDRTANLRNSIGFVIAVEGKIVDEDFDPSAKGNIPSSEDPVKYGKTLAYEVAKTQGGISLIVVSGMKYGAYVESKGKVVLTSAEQFTKTYLPMLLKQLR